MITKSHNFRTRNTHYISIFCLAVLFVIMGCSKDEPSTVDTEEVGASDDDTDSMDSPIEEPADVDMNQDGAINILLLGPSSSIGSGVSTFSLGPVAEELRTILTEDAKVTAEIHIEYEDTYKDKTMMVGLGSDTGN